MAALTEWLHLMLAEIARKREDAERARAEEAQRTNEQHANETRERKREVSSL
jgi:hypothetical protein